MRLLNSPCALKLTPDFSQLHLKLANLQASRIAVSGLNTNNAALAKLHGAFAPARCPGDVWAAYAFCMHRKNDISHHVMAQRMDRRPAAHLRGRSFIAAAGRKPELSCLKTLSACWPATCCQGLIVEDSLPKLACRQLAASSQPTSGCAAEGVGSGCEGAGTKSGQGVSLSGSTPSTGPNASACK